jgi:hypothetical protein
MRSHDVRGPDARAARLWRAPPRRRSLGSEFGPNLLRRFEAGNANQADRFHVKNEEMQRLIRLRDGLSNALLEKSALKNSKAA